MIPRILFLSPSDEPENERQNQAQEYARRQGEVKRKIFLLDH
jgi:hypothetical protein